MDSDRRHRTDNRVTILQNLIACDGRIDSLIEAVRSLPWDWAEPPLVIVTVDAIVNAINRYLVGSISGEELSVWAEAIDCREDVGYAVVGGEELRQLIFEIASPFFNTPVTLEVAREFKSRAEKSAR